MTVHEAALAWLHKQLRKKNIALHIATHKAKPSEKEIEDIEDAIDVIRYLIDLVTVGGT